jgi:hypothetical protein
MRLPSSVRPTGANPRALFGLTLSGRWSRAIKWHESTDIVL